MLRTWGRNGARYQVLESAPRTRATHRRATPTKNVGEVGRDCESQGLPAVSADGVAVYLRCTSDYAGNQLDVVPFRDLREPHKSDRIVVYEVTGAGEYAMTEGASRRARGRANARLRRAKFKPLIPLRYPHQDFSVFDAWDSGPIFGAGMRLHYILSEGKFSIDGSLVATGRYPGDKAEGWCCDSLAGNTGVAEEVETCLLPASIFGAWGDPQGRVVVLQLESAEGPDGCEQGPNFMVVRPDATEGRPTHPVIEATATRECAVSSPSAHVECAQSTARIR